MTTLSIKLRNGHGTYGHEVVESIRDWVNNSPEVWETPDMRGTLSLGRGGHLTLTNCPVDAVDWLRQMLEADANSCQQAKDNWAGDRTRTYGNACLDWAYDLEEALGRAAPQ